MRLKFIFLALFSLLLVSSVHAATTKTIWNDTFDTDAGWSGGTYDGTNKWYDTTGSWGTWTSPDYDIANFTWVRWCSQQYVESAHQTLKLYIGETTGTTSDPHFLLDAGYVTKPEPGYTPDYTGSYGGWHEFCIEMNESNEKLEFFYDGTSRWSYTGTAFDFAAGEDYLRIAVGNLNGATEYRIDNSTVTVLCDELPAGACQSAPTTPTSISCNGGSCNATFYDSVNISCGGSTDAEGDTITYSIDKGRNTTTASVSFVNATYLSNQSETAFTVAGTTYVDGVRVTMTGVNGAKYLVTGYAEGRLNTTALAMRAQMLQNTTVLALDQDLPGVAGTTVGDQSPFYFAYIYTGTGADVHFKWQFSASGAAGLMNVTRNYIQVIRLDNIPNASYNSTYTSGTQSNVNNVWGDAAGDTDFTTITPATSGRYLFIARATLNSDSTTSSFAYRARLNATSGGTMEYTPYLNGSETTWSFDRREDRTTAEETGMAMVFVRNLTGGTTYNFSHQVADIDTTASADWKYRSLVVVRLDDVFGNVTTSNVTAQTSTTATTWQNATTITLAGEAADWLVMASNHLRIDSTTVDLQGRIAYDETDKSLRTARAKDVANILGDGFSWLLAKDSSSHVIANQYRRQDASGTVYAKNMELVGFRLGYWNTTYTPTINWTTVGNHTTGNYTWNLTNDTGITYDWFRCRAIDLSGKNEWSSYFNISTNFTAALTVGDACSCSGTANCVLSTSTCTATTANINVGGYNLTIQGGNTFNINHNITNYQWCFIMSTQVVINATKGGLRGE